MRNRFRRRALVLAALTSLPSLAPAATTLFWDANSLLGGAGTWDVATTSNWRTTNTPGAPDSTWTPNDGSVNPTFNGTATYVVTIAPGTTINAGTLTLGTTAGNTTITGGTLLNLTNPAASVFMNTNQSGSARAQIIASPIGGSDIAVVANAGSTNSFVTLGANTATPTAAANQNVFTGNLIFAGGGVPGVNNFTQININNALALPASATVMMQRDFSQLLFTAAGASGTTAYSATFNNNINLNSAGAGWQTSGVGSANNGSIITLGGVLSGNADLTVKVGASGGQGTIVLAGNSTYTGNTNVATAVAATTSLKLGVNNALPQTTLLTMGAASAQGNVDLAGFSQTVAGLSAGTASTANLFNSVGANLSTLTISGNQVTTYAGLLGQGANSHIALALGPSNTGILTLTNANLYDGGTVIQGGTLLANNTSGSATGTGPVTVAAGGRLGGSGTVSGAVTSVGSLAPGGVNNVATLTLAGGLSYGGALNSSLDFEFSPTANDKLAVSNLIPVPGVGPGFTVNLSDLGSGIKNQTYTLITGTLGTLDPSTVFTIGAKPASGAARSATFSLAQNPSTSAIELTVTGVGKFLTWKGDVSGTGDIDTTTANWDDNGSAAMYAEPDDLTFGDSANGAGPVTVNLPGAINPGRLTFNVGARNYTLTGAGSIVGNPTLVKTGTGTLTLGVINSSSSPIALRQGTLAVDTLFNNGFATLSFEGGTLAPTMTVSTNRPITVTGSGAISLTAGDATLSQSVTGTGTLTKSGTGNLTVGQVNLSGLNIAAGPAVLAAPANRVSVLTLPVTAGSTSKLDINDKTLAISNQITETGLRAMLTAARNGANWDGAAGLTSSLAANDANKVIGIGYFTAADLGLSSLGGIPLAPSDTLLRATYYGDTDNNGKIDGSDFARIDRTVAKGLPPRWANGDFNYDGLVNTADYFLIDRSFLLQSGTLDPEFLANRANQFGDAYVSSLLASVPEPASLAACGLAVLPLLRRRSKR